MIFFRRETMLNDIEILPTTGGDKLVQYTMQEGDDEILLTQGIYGQVLDFSDGTSTVIDHEGRVTTLRPDMSLTLVEDNEIIDVTEYEVDDADEFFEKITMDALKGMKETD